MVVRSYALLTAATVSSLLAMTPVHAQSETPAAPAADAEPLDAAAAPAAAATSADATEVTLDIPAGDLQQALEAFSAQTGLQLDYAPELVADKTAPAVQGTMTPSAGLEQLLATAGVFHVAQQDGSIVLSATVAAIALPAEAPPAPASVEEGGTNALNEIVVTATKRRQTLRSIPSTVNVMTGEKLEAQGARELADFVDQVPGLQMQDAAVTNSRKIVVRGIAPDNVGNQTVGTLLGDVPVSDAIGNYTVVDPDTWDLDTVEVLKGPQGTLFGASSLAGIIRYVPAAPRLGAWQGKAAVEYMTTEDGGAAPAYNAMINVPVGETLAFRLSGTQETRPGVIDIDTPNRHEKDADEARKWSGRAMVRWEPTERLSLNGWYMAQQRDADEQSFTTNYDADYTRYDAPSESPTKQSFDVGVIDARYQFDWATLVSLSAYQHKQNEFNIDASYVLAEPLADAGVEVGRTLRNADARGFMQELRLVSPDDGNWLWQGGAFYSKFDADVFSDIFFTNPLSASALLQLLPEALRPAVVSENGVSLGNAHLDPLTATEAALFGELTRKLGSVNVTLGGRLYKTKTAGKSTVSGLAPFLSTGQVVTVEDLQVEDQGFSPKAAITWQSSRDVLFYGSVSRGFQYGGVNNRAVPSPGSTTPKTYDSSTLWSYEAGVRSDWFDRALRADLTLYYQDWSNAQISQQVPPADFYIDNVGKVKVKGLEASLRYITPIEGLSLELAGGYLDSKTAGPFVAGDGSTIESGAEMPNAPRIQGTVSINYARQLGDVWMTSSALQLNHVGDAWGNIEHTGYLEARDLLNFNVSVTRTDLSFAPTLGLVVNNITDQRKIVSATESPEGAQQDLQSAYAVGYTRPRTVIARLSVSFQ